MIFQLKCLFTDSTQALQMAPNNHTPCSRQKGPSLALTPASAEKAAELTGRSLSSASSLSSHFGRTCSQTVLTRRRKLDPATLPHRKLDPATLPQSPAAVSLSCSFVDSALLLVNQPLGPGQAFCKLTQTPFPPGWYYHPHENGVNH